MPESDELLAANLKKLDAETRKLQAEIEKLNREGVAARYAEPRAWLVSLSVVVGIGVSVFGIYEALSEIGFRNRQLGLEAQVKSNEIFLNQVLDRMSGIKVVRLEADKQGRLKLKSRDNYGDIIQVGSYGAAVSLACQFKNLRLAAQSALTFQVAVQPKDVSAKDMLRRLERGCPSGWDELTDEEKQNWYKHAKD